MRQLFVLFLVAVVLALALPAGASAERRVALVIGNAAYKTSPLKNPANDARDMATALKGLGFDVRLVTDATLPQMEMAVREFGKDLRQGGVGLFYYAGHGVQVAGENYLIPVNAVIQSEGDVKYGGLNAGLVLAKMEDAGNGLNLVILDACRSNPFARSFRSAEQGLAKMDAPTGSLIAYSTAPGSVASDGGGRNGVYTRFLLETIKTPDLPVSEVFMRVRQSVVKETAKKQVPWEASSLIGQFYFAKAGSGKVFPSSSKQALEEDTPTPTLPESVSVSFEDIKAKAQTKSKAEAEAKEKWQAWLTEMKKSVADAERLEAENSLSPAQKAEVWGRIGKAFSADNPYTNEDESLRKTIAARKDYWLASVQRNEPIKPNIIEKDITGISLPRVTPEAESLFKSGHDIWGKSQDLWMMSGLRETPEVEKLDREAARLYRSAGERGHVGAIRQLGNLYSGGRGVPRNRAEAIRLLTIAAEHGDVSAHASLGDKYNSGNPADGKPEPEKAAYWYLKAASLGDDRAQLNIGSMYFSGNGVQKSSEEGIRWYKKSASQGNKFAMMSLARQYESGEGLPQSDAEAVKLYKKVAETGLLDAQHKLGLAYASGRGINRDNISGLSWLMLAAQYGDKEATASRDNLASEMSQSQIDVALERAKKWQANFMRKMKVQGNR